VRWVDNRRRLGIVGQYISGGQYYSFIATVQPVSVDEWIDERILGR
jgi:hypothetical protein